MRTSSIQQGTWTHYEVLGVSESATPEEIQSAFRKVMLRVHADQFQSPEAHSLSKMIIQAHSVLPNAESRRQYDLELRRPTPAASDGASPNGEPSQTKR
jgi:DnaJ-class molecular chaperone